MRIGDGDKSADADHAESSGSALAFSETGALAQPLAKWPRELDNHQIGAGVEDNRYRSE